MYRWICSEQSKLFDPILMRSVQELMKKLLLNLVAELKKLGATVLYADTSSIVLATEKHGMREAMGYTDYILETVRKKDLFQWLSLAPCKAWHTLLFYDKYNYLGVQAPLPAEMVEALSQHPGSLTGGSQLLDHEDFNITMDVLRHPVFDVSMNLKDYLPGALSDAFMSAIGEFVWVPWREAVKELLQMQPSNQINADQNADGDSPLQKLTEIQNAYLSNNLPSKMTEKLLKATKQIFMHIGSKDGNPSHDFPRQAGSHLEPSELGTPALAFVKSVCQLYALDKTHKDSVMMLRRQLLRMVHVKEFGPESSWKDPCASLVIPDIVCPSCQNCQDLDMCRDPTLQVDGAILCPVCNAQRDMDALEMKLINSFRSMMDAYSIQDLKCNKCGTTATEHLQQQCDCCGGHLGATMPPKDVRKRIQTFKRVAEAQKMDNLLEIAESMDRIA